MLEQIRAEPYAELKIPLWDYDTARDTISSVKGLPSENGLLIFAGIGGTVYAFEAKGKNDYGKNDYSIKMRFTVEHGAKWISIATDGVLDSTDISKKLVCIAASSYHNSVPRTRFISIDPEKIEEESLEMVDDFYLPMNISTLLINPAFYGNFVVQYANSGGGFLMLDRRTASVRWHIKGSAYVLQDNFFIVPEHIAVLPDVSFIPVNSSVFIIDNSTGNIIDGIDEKPEAMFGITNCAFLVDREKAIKYCMEDGRVELKAIVKFPVKLSGRIVIPVSSNQQIVPIIDTWEERAVFIDGIENKVVGVVDRLNIASLSSNRGVIDWIYSEEENIGYLIIGNYRSINVFKLTVTADRSY